jgi:NAD(P)-dependent dehydrogenase (short-subunit alcohol dehydrogenase family)
VTADGGFEQVAGRLAGKVALVTGTSPNIGGVAASGFAAAGARVACNDLDPGVAADRVARIEAAGGEAMAVPADVTDEAAVEAVVAAVVERWGQVDVVLNNAVQFNAKGLLDMPVDQYRRQLDIILGGCFLVTRAAARAMIAAGTRGSIINVLSTAAWQGQAGNVGYCTGKSGLINFTRSVAMELAPHGIRVNGFTPTATRPDDPHRREVFDSRAGLAADTGMDFWTQVPLRLPTPSDYVAPLVFLASDDSALMTGDSITVDGGALSKYWPQRPARLDP